MLYTCDRCHAKFDGAEGDRFTAGFYYVHEGHWAKYANPFETVLCDHCMWCDPRYIADYGPWSCEAAKNDISGVHLRG